MDKETLIYLAFLAIYWVSRMIKKRKKANAPNKPQKASGTLPNSFADLLKEFTQEKNTYEIEDSRSDYSEFQENEDSNALKGSEDSRQGIIEEEGKRNKYQQAIEEGLIADGTKGRNPVKVKEKDEHFKEFAIKKKNSVFTKSIRSQLANPTDIKKAVVLSEVLKTKF